MKRTDLEINGNLYTDVIYKDKEYIIQETGTIKNTKYNNKYKLINTKGGPDYHTHLNNIGVCKKIINFERRKKLLLQARKYLIISCSRVTLDPEYRKKCIDYYNLKRNKGKQKYYNRPMIYDKR